MENPEDITVLVNMFTHRKWVPLLCFALVYVARWFSNDTRWLPDVAGKYKPLVLAGLNIVAFGAAKVASGMPWESAVGLALASFLVGLGSHAVTFLPAGKDLPVPEAAKKDEFKKPTVPPPPPPTGGAAVGAALFVLCAFMLGCTPAAAAPPCSPPGSADTYRAKVGGEYLARLDKECADYTAPLDCPAYDGIRADYLRKRAEYTECQK